MTEWRRTFRNSWVFLFPSHICLYVNSYYSNNHPKKEPQETPTRWDGNREATNTDTQRNSSNNTITCLFQWSLSHTVGQKYCKARKQKEKKKQGKLNKCVFMCFRADTLGKHQSESVTVSRSTSIRQAVIVQSYTHTLTAWAECEFTFVNLTAPTQSYEKSHGANTPFISPCMTISSRLFHVAEILHVLKLSDFLQDGWLY